MNPTAETKYVTITGHLAFEETYAEQLFTSLEDNDIFQYVVTVTHEDNTTDTYTTSASGSTGYTSLTNIDLNFTIPNIPYQEGDTVEVTSVQDKTLTSWEYFNDSHPTGINTSGVDADGNLAVGDVTISIKLTDFTVKSTVIGGTGSETASYHGDWSMKDSKTGKTASGTISNFTLQGNGTQTISLPSGVQLNLTGSLGDSYSLVKTSGMNTETKTASGKLNATGFNTADFIWVKTSTKTFTKTWLDNPSTSHTDTENLVHLEYSLDGGTTWSSVFTKGEDNTDNAFNLDGPARDSVASTADGSSYRFTYTRLPDQFYTVDSSGNKNVVDVQYRLNESDVPDGYSAKIDENGDLQNVEEYELKATIQWNDNGNSESVRPTTDNIASKIDIWNGEGGSKITGSEGIELTVTDNGDNTYTIAVNNLPSFKDNDRSHPLSYYLTMKDLDAFPTGETYIKTLENAEGVHENSTDIWNGAVITYTLSGTTDQSVSVVWKDLFDNEERPSATLSLYRYTTGSAQKELAAVATVDNTTANGERKSYEFKDLDVYDSEGNPYHYIFQEKLSSTDSYSVSYADADENVLQVEQCENGGVITNEDTHNSVNIRVKMNWIAKGTTLKIASYDNIYVGLKRYYTDASGNTVYEDAFLTTDNNEGVTTINGKPVVNITGFNDLNDLTERVTFDGLPMYTTTEDGVKRFYTYVPYEVITEGTFKSDNTGDTLDEGDKFSIDDDYYTVVTADAVNCNDSELKDTEQVNLTNKLSGTICFRLQKIWAYDNDNITGEIEYQIHQVNAYGVDKVVYSGTYTGSSTEAAWDPIVPEFTADLYSASDSTRYSYYVTESISGMQYRGEYSITKNDTNLDADLVDNITMTNENGQGGDGVVLNVNLKKKWVDGGNTSARQPVTVKMYRINPDKSYSRPEEWDEENIGIFTLSEDNAWQVSYHVDFNDSEIEKYFKDADGNTYEKTDIKNHITFLETAIGDTEVNLENDTCTVTIDTNGQKTAYKYSVLYNEAHTEITNVINSEVTYQIDKEWYDGHYVNDRPTVTFYLYRTRTILADDGSSAGTEQETYAKCTVSIVDGQPTAEIDLSDAAESENITATFVLGSKDNSGNENAEGLALNDYRLIFEGLPMYDMTTGMKYTYEDSESMPEGTEYSNAATDEYPALANRTSTYGDNDENLKIESTVRNHRDQQYESVSFTKQWYDDSNRLQTRPTLHLNLAVQVKSANQDQNKLIPISGDFLATQNDSDGNNYTYSLAYDMPKYVDESLIELSNGQLTEDDIGAEVVYYASENVGTTKNYQSVVTTVITDSEPLTTSGSGASYTKTGDNTYQVTKGSESDVYIDNGGTFTNTLSNTMSAEGTVLFVNIPYSYQADSDIMPQDGDITFTLLRKYEGDDDSSYTVVKDGNNAITATLVKDKNTGTYSFAFQKDGKTIQLPMYDDQGRAYRYSVSQTLGTNSITGVDFNDIYEETYISRDLTVTDTYIQTPRSITVSKTFDITEWTGDEDNLKYPSVTFTLYRVDPNDTYGEVTPTVVATHTITSDEFKTAVHTDNNKKLSDTIKFTFSDLTDLTPHGEHFQYVVVESSIYGYETTNTVSSASDTAEMQTIEKNDNGAITSFDAIDSVDFTNTYQNTKIMLNGHKDWQPDDLNEVLLPSNSKLTFKIIAKIGDTQKVYTQGTDFGVSWRLAKGDSDFTITTTALTALTFDQYTVDGQRILYQIQEDTSNWNSDSELRNFRVTTGTVSKWSSAAEEDGDLNVGTLVNTYGPKQLTVTKEWDDNYNKNKLRPRSISVKLQYRKLGSTDDWADVNANLLGKENYTVKDASEGGTTLTVDGVNPVTYALNDTYQDTGNTWSDCMTFINLPSYDSAGNELEYQAVETAINGQTLTTLAGEDNAAASYKRTKQETTASSGNKIYSSVIRNEIIRTSVTATKTWVEDDNNKYDERPSTITLYLQRRTANTDWSYVYLTEKAEGSSDYPIFTININASDSWTRAVEYLPALDDAGNTYYYRLTENGSLTDDNAVKDDQDATAGTVISGTNGELSYTGSETTTVGDQKSTTAITNKLTNKTTFTLTKTWLGEAASKVTFELRYKDKTTGNKYKSFTTPVTITLDASNGWTTTIEGLPMTGSDGSARSYMAFELDDEGADASGDFSLDGKTYRLENVIAQDGTSKEWTQTTTNILRTTLTVNKTWVDGKNRDGKRPTSLAITVKGPVGAHIDSTEITIINADTGVSKTINITADQDTGYSTSFVVDAYNSNDIDANNPEGHATYTVSESVSGYTAKYVLSKSGTYVPVVVTEGDQTQAADTVAITNTYGIKLFDFKVTKTWDDGSNQYKTRPDNISLTLQYSVDDGKTWKDVTHKDKDSATTFNDLYEDRSIAYTTSAVTQTMGNNDNESVTWNNLPVYARVNGKTVTIQYKAVEAAINGYNNNQAKETAAVTSDDYETDQAQSLVNKLDTTSLTITKKWEDNSDNNGQRPDNLKVTIQQTPKGGADGTTVELKGDTNTWTYTVDDLPETSSDGTTYTYTVEETLPAGYTKSQTGTTLTNTVTPVSVTLSLTKSFDNWDKAPKAPDGFKFTLTGKDMPMPSDNTSIVITKDTTDYTASFGTISYDKVGTYTYTIQETNGGIDGLGYDWDEEQSAQRTHTVTVTVSVNEANELEAVVKYDESDDLTITNTYNPATASFQVEKYFNDWTYAGNGFVFDLAAGDSTDANGETIDTPMPSSTVLAITSKDAEDQIKTKTTEDGITYESGSGAFGVITYEKAGTYNYTITEENSGVDGVAYDTTEHNVQVVVTKANDASNALSVEVMYDGESTDALAVTNTFTSVTFTPEVTKKFNDWTKADSFTFNLTADDSDTPTASGNGMQAVVTEADQTVEFGELTFTKAGTYQYTINEVNDGQDGVSYDVSDHTLTIVVEKASDETNALTITSAKYDVTDDSEGLDVLTIENTYTPVTTSLQLTKSFNGWTDSSKYENFFDDAVFTMDLKAVDDAPMPENAEDGVAVVEATKSDPSPVFEEITFEKAGEYHYTIQEENGQLDGVDYDTEGGTEPKVHEVVVKVAKKDDATNELYVESVTYDGEDSLEIVNTFTPYDPPVEVTKNFNLWPSEHTFTFDIEAITEGAPMPTNLTAEVTSDNRTATFENIEFWEVGEGLYEYQIQERNDHQANITYDDSPHKAYIRVMKKDDATNELYGEVYYDDHQTSLTVTNTYNAPSEGKTTGVRTGDDTNVGGYLMLMLASICALTGMVTYRKRKRRKS